MNTKERMIDMIAGMPGEIAFKKQQIFLENDLNQDMFPDPFGRDKRKL